MASTEAGTKAKHELQVYNYDSAKYHVTGSPTNHKPMINNFVVFI